jgi:hypothetical protein
MNAIEPSVGVFQLERQRLFRLASRFEAGPLKSALICGSMKLFDVHDALVDPPIAIMSSPYTPRKKNMATRLWVTS